MNVSRAAIFAAFIFATPLLSAQASENAAAVTGPRFMPLVKKQVAPTPKLRPATSTLSAPAIAPSAFLPIDTQRKRAIRSSDALKRPSETKQQVSDAAFVGTKDANELLLYVYGDMR
jgi:hypothetical protein